MASRLWALFLALVVLAGPGHAQPVAVADAALEARVRAIASDLRCLVCQNQSIADSQAALAVDLRQQVREKLRHGESEQQIIAFMTARYGDFVLYRPPLRAGTWLLWFGPVLMVVVGLLALGWALRRRSRLPADRFEADPEDAEAGTSRP
ncbi:MAG: cytochrome c-type biogenesis protein CcmH [Burkholderiaceae bacterium]|nr:cytochrome c-type biogenesis protein CcmH [Burkholderiaceae bacterium]